MNDDEVFAKIYLPGQGPPMTNNKFQLIPRLIGHILAYNICPKTGSYNYCSRDLATYDYAIMANLEVNWARVMFNTLVREPSTFLPYDAFLTHIFRKFKIDLASESNVVKVFAPFDRSVLLRMKLLETPPPQPTFPSHGSHRASQFSTHPTSTNAFYNSLSLRSQIFDLNKLL